MAPPARRRGQAQGQGQAPLATRWDPFADIEALNDQLSQLLTNIGDVSGVTEGFTPLADIEEMDDAYVVELELPGVRKEDINVSLTGRRLTVSGERKEKDRVGIVRRRTRTIGRFQFEVVLPGDVDEDGVQASLEHGVLTVRVPKASAERPRRIDVS